MTAETLGHFFGIKPFSASLGSPHTIGGFETHGFAVLIGVLLFRASISSDRLPWHRIGLITHLFLGAANLMFWPSFAHQNLVAAGYVTTTLHAVLVILQLACLRTRK